MALRKNDFQRPAKGGSTPAFAYQRAAIAAEKTCYKNNLLRKCGLLAHTSAAFLKNCCTEKLFISPVAHMLQPFLYKKAAM